MPPIPPSDPILRTLFDDTAALKEAIIVARENEILTNAAATQMLSSVARIIQIIREVDRPEGAPVRPEWDRPLPEFMRWPSRTFPCPKCDQTKTGHVSYHPASRNGPERMQHSCVCGYSLYTKPSDGSNFEFGHISTQAPG